MHYKNKYTNLFYIFSKILVDFTIKLFFIRRPFLLIFIHIIVVFRKVEKFDFRKLNFQITEIFPSSVISCSTVVRTKNYAVFRKVPTCGEKLTRKSFLHIL